MAFDFNNWKTVIKPFFKGIFEKGIIRGMVSTGLVIITQALSQDLWLNFIISVYNDQFDGAIVPPDDSGKLTYTIISLVVGLWLIFAGIRFYFKTKHKSKTQSLVLIKHSSIQAVNYTKIDNDFSDFKLEEFRINQLEEMRSLDKSNIEHALREQEKEANRIATFIDDNSNMNVAYLSLAHIPFTILLGYKISDKSDFDFYEWNQNELIWENVRSKPKLEYPSLLLKEDNKLQEHQMTQEIVIKVGVTYHIPEQDVQELQLEHLNSYYLHLDPPRRNAVQSLEQLKSYKKQFRDLLDQVNQQHPCLKKIHLFVSAQPSLAFILGSAISVRMDTKMKIYNYVRQENPKYKWSITLPRENERTEIKIYEARD